MTAKGNRGFADLIAGEGARAATRLPPRTGVLAGRENRLAELASGHAVTRVHEQVDPARCRIWAHHNRDYARLDATICADLIESMKAQGRQEVPAIVRRISGDPAADYEVICGARRHWTVSWLRAHHDGGFRFLIEPRELSDEEAFRVADLENRSRKDLTDYERAADYARAIERYYDGSQQRMAERLNVTTSWLSRYLELAKLPQDVVAAFGNPAAIGISHAAKLAPLLRNPALRKQVGQNAATLAGEQAARSAAGQAPLPPAQVVATLAATRKPAAKARRAAVRDGARVLVSGERGPGGGITIAVPATSRDRVSLLAAINMLLDDLGVPTSSATTDDLGTAPPRKNEE